MNNSPIGVFDSGMGGLSVWRELRRQLPHESLIYFGDGANCPYGDKPAAQVVGYIEQATRLLVERGVKMVVLACNTATMMAIRHLRETHDIPFVGMEPAIKPAAGTTESGVVGVLATRAALESEWFAELCDRYHNAAKIVTGVGEGFVAAVEAGREDTPETLELVRAAVTPLVEAGADKIVLGCTHYPFLTEQIRRVVSDRNIEIIDPAPAIVRRVEWLLDEHDLRASADNTPRYDFVTLAGGDYLDRLKAKALR